MLGRFPCIDHKYRGRWNSSASLVAISIILPVVGLPVEAIGVIWVTDRILDMCRTSVNVYSDTVAAVIIDNSEGGSPIP